MAAHSHVRENLAICLFLACIAFLSSRYNSSAAFERPVHFAIFTLLTSGTAIAAWGYGVKSKVLPVDCDHDATYSSFKKQSWPAQINSAVESIRNPSFRGQTLAVCGIVVRVLLTWCIDRTNHCSSTSFETFLPLIIMIYVAGLPRFFQRGKKVNEESNGSKSWLASAHYRACAFFWAHGSYNTVTLTSSSTGAICPVGYLSWERYMPLAQCTVVFIDAGLITEVAKLRQDSSNAWPRISRILLISAGVLTGLATFSFYHPYNIRSALALDWVTLRDLILDGSVACVALVTGVCFLATVHPCTIAVVVTAVVIYMYHMARTLRSAPPTNKWTMTLSAISTVAYPGILLHVDPQAAVISKMPATDARLRRFLDRCYLVLLGVFFATHLIFYPDAVPAGAVSLPDLIESAIIRSDSWIAQANHSTSLAGAVEEYRRRNQVPPPPNFDKWYDYAVAQNSVIIDDFGQISADLQPFWGTSPAGLREQTRHILSYTPWLNVAGIRIRSGKVDIMPGVPDSHAWMMAAMREMIEPFAEHLPDLDFAMNLHDEPRVVVPYEDMQELKTKGQLARLKVARQDELRPLDASKTPEWSDVEVRDNTDPSPYFTNELRNQIYYNFVAPACPPTSAARSWRWWSRKDTCHACLTPHTTSIFETDSRVVVDWTKAMDPCHQPDLAYLHGFLLSPAAFMPTTRALPVFSQAKADGFADILLPSPWSFNDKATYDGEEGISWEQKENTMFWRGSASDGYAARGSWQTSLRARLVYVASRFAWPASYKPRDDREPPGVDMGFVGEFQKCHPRDCRAEEGTLRRPGADKSPVERVPFEQHWRYRHLVDLDGAGFSGRFLSFLRSRSLVYRTGLFRTWFGERVHAWRHYVPVDVRLHELWDLLWFFGGDERGAGLAENIAMEGREWAAKALRKEDMQVYMFRLLLEWGRLVDDQRETLGYAA